MSYLALPRIGFLGTDAYTNPPTANNHFFVDNDTVQLLNPPVREGLPAMDPLAYQNWVTSLLTYAEDPDDPEMPAGWNYYGDHLTTFGHASINSLWLENAAAPLTATDDPLMGARVVVTGVLVDLNPADAYCSQLISAVFKVVQVDSAGKVTDLIHGTAPTVAYCRWLNMNRWPGAGTFQFVVPNAHLTFNNKVASPALQAVQEKAAQQAGILVRFCLYAMQQNPQNTPEYLSRQFQQGNYIANPWIGRVLGSLGVWNGTDMTSAPVGRLLYIPSSPFNGQTSPLSSAPPPPIIKTHEDLERLGRRPASPAAAAEAALPRDMLATPGLGPAPATPAPAGAAAEPIWLAMPGLGPAVAVVDQARQVVMLDLLTTFPENNPPGDTNLTMEKYNFGPVILCLQYHDTQGQSQVVTLGPVAYDQSTYEAQAGVVEVSYAAQAGVASYIDRGQLILSRDAVAGNVLLEEISTLQVETDDRCVYLKQNTPRTITLHTFYKGEPIQEATTIGLDQWRSCPPSVTLTPGNPPQIAVGAYTDQLVPTTDPAGLDIPAMVTALPGGQASLTITPRVAGCYKIRFIPPGAVANSPYPNFPLYFFTNVRVLPTDDYSNYTDEQINSWAFMYEHVFSYYAVVYPIMSTIIPWGPAEAPGMSDRVRQFAALIRASVDERRLGSVLAMPIARELSAGKRALIQRWCDLQLRAD